MLPEWEKVRLINNLKASMIEEPEVGEGRFAEEHRKVSDKASYISLSASEEDGRCSKVPKAISSRDDVMERISRKD